MKTIKLFLASSEEMDYDRMVFGNLVRRLDDVYEKRGLRIKLFEWEDYDAAFNDRRKQDEYNDRVKDSDIFLALFHKKAGKFTIEEFDVASAQFKEKASPKVYTYLRDLQPGEEESPELAEFKKRLFYEMGHYWCRYDNRDSLQLQFVMQLQLVESSLGDSVKVENGEVNIDGLKVASMDRLQFAAANEDYLKQQEEIHSLHDEIVEMQLDLEKKEKKLEKRRARLEEDPDDEDNQEDYQDAKEDVDKLVEKLQPKLDKYNKLKKEFAEYQTLLFDTAKRVAQLQGQRITERMRRAMDAFNAGKVREANIILDEAEADAQRNLEDYKQSKEITELKRQAVISSIEELLLKASTVMADASIPIEERIEQTDVIYAQAVEMAKEVKYDEEKYAHILADYGHFLYYHSLYNKSLDIFLKAILLQERVFGKEHFETAESYNNIGLVYYEQGLLSNALDYFTLALNAQINALGLSHPDTSSSFNNIGLVYDTQGNYLKSLEYYSKALEIRKKLYGEEHPDIANSLNNIGAYYYHQEDYAKALELFKKALDIHKRVLGEEHPALAFEYSNIGSVYYAQEDYLLAIEFYNRALLIREKALGKNHSDTASSYNNIGLSYSELGEYSKALQYCTDALEIRQRVLGMQHPQTVTSYSCIGDILFELGKYQESLSFLQALKMNETIHGKSNPDIAIDINNIGATYEKLGEIEKALEYRTKAVEILEKHYGPEHQNVIFIKSKMKELQKRIDTGDA